MLRGFRNFLMRGDVVVVAVGLVLMMAICLIALAPSVILVLLLRRFVVEGLSAGAMKG
jgi:large-conductance mechanosensitive channel